MRARTHRTTCDEAIALHRSTESATCRGLRALEASERQLTDEHLDVYDGRDGWWNPDHGVIELPDGWEFVPSGDAFITRRVKAAGRYWLAWTPRTRNRPHRRALGLIAPAKAISGAREAADATADRRAAQRGSGAKYRERQEAGYRDRLAVAIVSYLDFAPAHAELADGIAQRAAARAGEVGSGRVGRTQLLSLERRAELAARADIRHNHTNYEDHLAEIDLHGDDWLYAEIKADAHESVDDFIERHRQR